MKRMMKIEQEPVVGLYNVDKEDVKTFEISRVIKIKELMVAFG